VPGSAEAGLVVSDIEAARDELVSRGVAVSDIWHGPPFPVEARQPGPDPERSSYGSFVYFTDPDSNARGSRTPSAQLRALPLYEWMHVTATPLEPHPNDPAGPSS
jgi:hypothetical protein